MHRSATIHDTPYARRHRREIRSRQREEPLRDPKGEPAWLDWLVIVIGYVAVWKAVRWLVDIHPAFGVVLGVLFIMVLAFLWGRERYYNTLSDLRARGR